MGSECHSWPYLQKQCRSEAKSHTREGKATLLVSTSSSRYTRSLQVRLSWPGRLVITIMQNMWTSCAKHTGCANNSREAVLCCAILCRAVLCYTVLCCAVLCCAVLCCAILCRGVLCYTVLCCAVLYCAVLCCAVLCRAILCCAVLCCAVLCCAVLWLCCVVVGLLLTLVGMHAQPRWPCRSPQASQAPTLQSAPLGSAP
jgi:hypothetical protein